jgi:hypothetical protein
MKTVEDFLKEKYGDHPADWKSNECDIRFNLSDIAKLIKEYTSEFKSTIVKSNRKIKKLEEDLNRLRNIRRFPF